MVVPKNCSRSNMQTLITSAGYFGNSDYQNRILKYNSVCYVSLAESADNFRIFMSPPMWLTVKLAATGMCEMTMVV